MVMRMLSSIARWDGSRVITRSKAFLYGDAISDLKTTYNTLSVWKADSLDDINDAIVALALGREKVEKLIYCLLDETILKNLDIQLSAANPGEGPGLDLATLSKHRDLIDIDYWRLGFLTEYMVNLLRDPNNYTTVTQKKVITLLTQYKDANRIDVSNMKPKLREYLKWSNPTP